MQKFYKITLLFLAVLFVVLHNVTPHTHDDGLGEQGISVMSSSEYGILGEGLFVDLGDDHLSVFSRCQNLSFNKIIVNSDHSQIAPLVSWLEYPCGDILSTQNISLYCVDYQDDVLSNVCVSRGPPVLG
ncbi:MAG TPA: hypothetical protein ENK85_10990 [Saprospiraceae bacterium]|nr:hypothetical protein [Saprospiraceae bacterium]